MAFVVPNRRGKFEIRESRSTADGPRSRTLATFGELTDEVLERAQERASAPLDPEALRAGARRAGASVAPASVDRAARDLIAELGRGAEIAPGLRAVLVDLLAEHETPRSASDAPHSIAEWAAATPEERGRALENLLLLADALPHGRRVGQDLAFPPLKVKPVK